MKFERDEHSPQETLMNALSDIEGANGVAIFIDKGDTFLCRSNMEHKDLQWLLDQAKFMVMVDMFGLNKSDEDQREGSD